MIKVGMVGLGGMRNYHRQGFLSVGAGVDAIADVDHNRLMAVGDEWQIPPSRRFLNCGQMLARMPELDAVDVVTSNASHYEVAIEALAAGKHVYVEKPPALNSGQVREMAAAAMKADRILVCAMNNRVRPDVADLLQRIALDEIGPINSAQAYWRRACGIPGFGGWFTTKALSGGGPGIDLLHMLDLALKFMGYLKPVHVLATTFDDFMADETRQGPWGIPNGNGVTNVESSLHAMITFEGGQCLQVIQSWAEMIEREVVSVAIQGRIGGAKIERLFGVDGLDDTATDTYELFRHEHGRQVVCAPVVGKDPTMGRVTAAAQFIRAIRGEAKPMTSLGELVILMDIIGAMYQSAETHEPVLIVS